MACDQTILELLSCCVDGEASPEQRVRAEAHLDTCTECREMVKEWRHGIEMLDWTYSRALPEDAAEPTFDPPMPAPERVPRRWTIPMPDMRILAAAAVLAFIALIGCTIYQQLTSLPTLGRSLSTAQTAQTVLVAKGIRLRIEPDTEISRLGDKAIRLVQGTVNAEVTNVRGFTIHTRKFEIVDEGTKFEVHSDSRTDRVTVTEGRVTVRKGMGEYHVGAGETLTSTGDKLHSETKLTQSGGNRMLSNSHGGVSIALFPYLILVILFVVFWVKMFVNALRREFKDSGTRIAWVLVILCLHGLGAIIYYCVVYKNDPSAKQSWLTRPMKVPLVGLRMDQRIVLWRNVLLAIVLAEIVAGSGVVFLSALLDHAPSKPGLLAGALMGVVIVLATVVRAMSLPLDRLPNLDER